MPKQRIMRTTTEDGTVLERARKALRIGEVVYYKGKKLKKVEGGWDELPSNAYAKIIIRQV